MSIVHDHVIFWPNGKGERECSELYFTTMLERDAIWDHGHATSFDDLHPDDYNRWCHLDMKLLVLQGSGHLGTITRYEEA